MSYRAAKPPLEKPELRRDLLLEIALDHGYADATHLGKAFRRRYGMPPMKFRRQLHLRA